MSSIKERVGLSDIIVDKDTVIPKYMNLTDQAGNVIAEVSAYHVGFEDEDGIECDENGE